MYQSKQSRLDARGRPGGHTIKVNDEVLLIHYVRLVYRCKVCLCKLELRRHGLECLADHTHWGFIHRNEAAKRRAKEDEQIEKIESVYEIVGGQIVVKEK